MEERRREMKLIKINRGEGEWKENNEDIREKKENVVGVKQGACVKKR